MNAVFTVFLKQIKETFKNKTVLVQFLMFPLLAVIMENTIKIDDMPEHFFAKLFSVMFIGMAPLTCMAAIISEEKEKNTLRVLMMTKVKPIQYLLGIGTYILAMCMTGTALFALLGEYRGKYLVNFLMIMIIGIIVSILVGAIIGIMSKTQMAATSLTIPIMMFFSFLPMLSMFNETVRKIAKICYSQQISLLINDNYSSIGGSYAVIAANLILAISIFMLAYHKKGLE